MYSIYTLSAYDQWFLTQTEKSKLQIEKRLDKIRQDGHFGHTRNLDDGLFELKFNDGKRVYYTVIPVNKVILILGGSKNGQNSDIFKAKSSIEKAKESAKNRG